MSSAWVGDLFPRRRLLGVRVEDCWNTLPSFSIVHVYLREDGRFTMSPGSTAGGNAPPRELLGYLEHCREIQREHCLVGDLYFYRSTSDGALPADAVNCKSRVTGEADAAILTAQGADTPASGEKVFVSSPSSPAPGPDREATMDFPICEPCSIRKCGDCLADRGIHNCWCFHRDGTKQPIQEPKTTRGVSAFNAAFQELKKIDDELDSAVDSALATQGLAPRPRKLEKPHRLTEGAICMRLGNDERAKRWAKAITSKAGTHSYWRSSGKTGREVRARVKKIHGATEKRMFSAVGGDSSAKSPAPLSWEKLEEYIRLVPTQEAPQDRQQGRDS